MSPDGPRPGDRAVMVAGEIFLTIIEEAVRRVLVNRVDLAPLRLLKVREAAELLSVDEATIRRMAAAGELEFLPVRSERRVTFASIESYLARQRAACEADKRRARVRRIS